jgi:NAD(P)-dependent dehydrogenase (short-subunit alcohol dehydrogenase family)
MRINVIGHAMLMKASLPHLIAAGGGSICVVTSGASYLGLPYLPAYSASKAALSALVRNVAAVHGKDGIRCNGVNPGHVVHDGRPDEGVTNPLRRFGRADDIASVMAFLLSEASGWITGQIVSANGGQGFRE